MAALVDANILSKIPLFHDLTLDQVSQLGKVLYQKIFAAGTTLMSAEQPGEVAYIILNGTVKIHVEQIDGSDVILAILGAGEIIGEMGILESQSRSATAVTLEKCSLVWLDRSTFQQYLHTMPPIAINLARILSRRLRLANAQIQSLATQDVYGRVARQIVAFAQEYGQTNASGDVVIPLRLTQSDLASLVGASRVRVNQVLAHYQQSHFISIHPNHHMIVHNQVALAARCQ